MAGTDGSTSQRKWILTWLPVAQPVVALRQNSVSRTFRSCGPVGILMNHCSLSPHCFVMFKRVQGDTPGLSTLACSPFGWDKAKAKTHSSSSQEKNLAKGKAI